MLPFAVLVNGITEGSFRGTSINLWEHARCSFSVLS